jgi:hypothetical protein
VETAWPTLRGLGRAGRCLLALTALLGNGAVAVFCVLLSYSEGSDQLRSAAQPFLLGSLSGALLAVLVLPDIADAVRRSRARWFVVPLVAGSGWFAASAMVLAGECGVWLWLLLASTVACALYAVARLPLWRAT